MINALFPLALLFCAVSASAQVTAPDTAFNKFYSLVTAPGVQVVSTATAGVPVYPAGLPTVSSSGGPVRVGRTGSLPLPGGVRLPVAITANVPGAAVAGAIGKAARILPFLGTGIAIYELGKELGFFLGKNADGSLEVTRPDPSVCSVSPCYEYLVSPSPTISGAWSVTPTAACLSAVAAYVAVVGTANFVATYGGNTASVCTINRTNGYGNFPTAIGARSVPPAASGFLPATIGDLADAIAAQSGWPSGSAVSQALIDAAKVTGETIVTEQPTITGPATVAGPVEKTSIPATPSTPYKDMTKSTNYNCTYVQGATVMDGGQAICTSKTTTTEAVRTVDPVTGATTTTTTTASEATKPAEIVPDDKPVEDPCIKNPGRIGCKEFGDPVNQVLPKSTVGVTLNPVAFSSNASCPAALPLSFVAGGRSFNQSLSFQPLCDVSVNYLRPLVLVLSAALAGFLFVGGLKS